MKIHHEPYISKDERLTVVPIDIEPKSGTLLSVCLNFGFMEEPMIEKYLQKLVNLYPQAVNKDFDKWVFHIIEQRVTSGAVGRIQKLRDAIFTFMYRLALNEDEQFGLGKKFHVTAEVVPVKIK